MIPATVLVIGNSDGIGLALTQQLLVRGHRVEGISRRAVQLRHERLRHFVIDVTDPDYTRELRRIFERVGKINRVVYCAGVGERSEPNSLERDLRVFDVNLMAAVRTAQIAVPALLRAGGGKFIVLSSQADIVVNDEYMSYSASKAAMSTYFEGLGLKLRRSPVRICNVRFGFVKTKLARAGIQPFRILPEQAAGLLLELIESKKCPLRVTYPRRMAILVSVIAWLQRMRVRFG